MAMLVSPQTTPWTLDWEPKGTYAVVKTGDRISNPFFTTVARADHTSGDGWFMMVNGATQANRVVWSQEVNVLPEQDYELSLWYMTWSVGGGNNNASIRISINDAEVSFETSFTVGIWEELWIPWNSGTSSSAEISIVETSRERSGNDFALDDISFVFRQKFYRGDCNFSQEPGAAVDISDAAALIDYLFSPEEDRFQPPCLDPCDCNDDGVVDHADMVCILQYVLPGSFGPSWPFFGPPAPGPGLLPDLTVTPASLDPTADLLGCPGAGVVSPLEDCANDVDDDGDGLMDSGDPDCQLAFLCGRPNPEINEFGLPVDHGPLPGPVVGSPGSFVQVCFFLKNPAGDIPGASQFGHVQGFSMAVAFSCDLVASPYIDISQTVLEFRGAEFVRIEVDNDPDDGDGCEAVIGVLRTRFLPSGEQQWFDPKFLEVYESLPPAIQEAFPPTTRLEIPPSDSFQNVGCMEFDIREGVPCGACLPVEFVDGVNGKQLGPGQEPGQRQGSLPDSRADGLRDLRGRTGNVSPGRLQLLARRRRDGRGRLRCRRGDQLRV